ncbi:MAG: hypothetical protein ACXWWH_02885 [Nitrospira sp.]
MQFINIIFIFTRMTPARSVRSSLLPVLILLVFFPSLLHAVSGGKTEVLPLQKASPAAVVIENAGGEPELRRLMRAKNGVTALQPGRVRFSEAPTGSYGFIAPKHLGLALITQSPDLVLEQASLSSDTYEVHKLADGSGLLVGFLGKDLASQVNVTERPKSVRIALYSNHSGKTPLIVAVPLEKLVVDRMPSRVESSMADSSVMLEMDLQSTANRKAPSQ